MNTRKIKAEFTTEMLTDIKNMHGMNYNENELKSGDMLYYEYKTTDKNEIELIREHTEIDFDDNRLFVYSISKKQLRKIKLGSIDGILEYIKMIRIIFNSVEVQDIERILELKLTKELTKSINIDILKNVIELRKEK